MLTDSPTGRRPPIPIMEMPRLSLVMPIRNGRRFLFEAVVSILDQTFRAFELIIVVTARATVLGKAAGLGKSRQPYLPCQKPRRSRTPPPANVR